jgi:O-antigen biosynthesis protein WbqP
VKRTVDIVAGIFGLACFAPVMALISVMILVTTGRPILLLQERVGRNGTPFEAVKFRTMRTGVPVIAKSLLRQSVDLYTPIGPFLRRWSLDELPQLWNVVRGEMTLVGPRPALPTQVDLLALRLAAGVMDQKPGLTGLAQVKGREALTLHTKVRFEALYRRRQSLGLDLLIIAWTFRAVLASRGAY